MKVALVGYGKMGKMIESIAQKNHHQIVARIASLHSTDWNFVPQADVCIEFSHPDSALENLERISQYGINCVIGTTGWYEHLDYVLQLTEKHSVGILYSPNFSIGIHLFLQMVRHAAQIMTSGYSPSGIEFHHAQKADCPSGTAKKIAHTINKAMHLIPPMEFSSVRSGTFPGTHTVMFDSFCDTITLTHEARSREGFAEGALLAAEWLLQKKGLFTFEDCLKEEAFACR